MPGTRPGTGVPRPDGEQGRAQGRARRAGVRRADRSTGPRIPQPLVHHRPQVVSGRVRRWSSASQSAGTDAHPVLYAGALDIAVDPRWYSTYEMACNCITHYIEKQKISAVPYAGTTEKELALLQNSEPLTLSESEALLDAA